MILLTSAIVAGGLVGLAVSLRDLPDVRVLQNYIPSQTTHIYDVNGRLLDSIHGEANRQVVPLDAISPHLKRAVLAIEDSSFYYSPGVNPVGILRAFMADLQADRIVEGGSTIPMQLVKNLFLTPKQALARKLAEAVLSVRLSQVFSKNQILEMYLNQVYWGRNDYGAQTAAETYFGKPAADLTLGEAAMMAGMIQAPEDYNPFASLRIAKERQALVLGRMRQLGWITPAQQAAALAEPIVLKKVSPFEPSVTPYATDVVVAELVDHFGSEALRRGGMQVQTTIALETQQMAQAVVTAGQKELVRQGYTIGQMALIAVDPRTHFIKAVVGGVDYAKSQYNRATQARRQPGSAFKPFVYYTAFASGKYNPDSPIDDSPVSYPDGNGGWYTPHDYDRTFWGRITLRRALEYSRNIPAVRLGQYVGLDNVIQTCRTLGITTPLEPVVSLPLGDMGISPLEMANAYAAFASNGWFAPATIILRVSDSYGNVLLDNTPQPQLVLNSWATASLTSVLEGVIAKGTGVAAQLSRPAAGKTGTTSDERDAWFVGYVPQLATAVWAGNDDDSSLGSTAVGGGLAAPVWRQFMEKALAKEPAENFPNPRQFPSP